MTGSLNVGDSTGGGGGNSDTCAEVLEAVQQVKENTDLIKSDTSTIKNDTSVIKSDVGLIKTIVQSMQTVLNSTKSAIDAIKKTVDNIFNDTTNIKSDTSLILMDTTKIKSDMTTLKNDASVLKNNTAELMQDTDSIITNVNTAIEAAEAAKNEATLAKEKAQEALKEIQKDRFPYCYAGTVNAGSSEWIDAFEITGNGIISLAIDHDFFSSGGSATSGQHSFSIDGSRPFGCAISPSSAAENNNMVLMPGHSAGASSGILFAYRFTKSFKARSKGGCVFTYIVQSDSELEGLGGDIVV